MGRSVGTSTPEQEGGRPDYPTILPIMVSRLSTARRVASVIHDGRGRYSGSPLSEGTLRSMDQVDDAVVLVRRAELRDRGVSAWRELQRVRRGEWSRLYGDVVALGPAATADLLRAALLVAWPDVALTAESAARLWLDREVNTPIQLAVPHGRRYPDTAEVRFHQTRIWVPPLLHRGLPVLPPAQAAATAAGGPLHEADRRALVTGLVQRRLTTPAEVAAAAADTPKRGRTQVRRLVEEVLAGAESGPEARLWRHIVEARLPVPALNHPVRGGARRIDGYLPELAAGYEVQSATHHSGTWREDSLRLGELLVEDGIVVLLVLVEHVEHRIDWVLGQLEGFWRNRAHELHRPFPRFVAPPTWVPSRSPAP